jgi:hypothetical protein
MSEYGENKEALEHVEKATDSEPVSGEELLNSEGLKRQLREAKTRLKSESQAKSRRTRVSDCPGIEAI